MYLNYCYFYWENLYFGPKTFIFWSFYLFHPIENDRNILKIELLENIINAYKIFKIQELPGASPLGLHQHFALDPLASSGHTPDPMPQI
jgi:hypothetical protein